MVLIKACTDLWGRDAIVDGDPAVCLLRGSIYVPFGLDGWGLYNEDGSLVRAAADFREGEHLSEGQVLQAERERLQTTEMATDGTYVYGGRINPHFGHFLVNTLPRFWAMSSLRTPNTKILCHGPGGPQSWFNVPFIRAAFALLGLSEGDFVSFGSRTRLGNVIVPSTAFEEQNAGFKIYGRMCRAMGDRVRATRELVTSNRPIYYSKTRLKIAVGTIANEIEIEDYMIGKGVRVIHPQEYSLAEQIAIMSSHPMILGSAGSFLHTSLFCPSRTITCLNVTELINTNYSIIDKLASNSASYYYPPAIRVDGRQEGIITQRYLPEARKVAEELLDRASRKP